MREIRADRTLVARASLEGHPTDVARGLLGTLLVRDEDDGSTTVVRLVETEAYREDDPASHSYRGRTDRNAVMFGPAGHLYVYFTYGMHFCMNVSCDEEDVGAAVLLRAAVLLAGGAHVRSRRGPRHRDLDLLRGPARLTQGLGIDREWDGLDLLDPTSPLRLERDGWRPDHDVVEVTPRTGIRHAADVPWRFHLDVPEVSRYVRHRHAP